MQALSYLFIAFAYFFAGSAAFAGGPAFAPEVDPSSLAPIASGITGAYLIYRMLRLRRQRNGQ